MDLGKTYLSTSPLSWRRGTKECKIKRKGMTPANITRISFSEYTTARLCVGSCVSVGSVFMHLRSWIPHIPHTAVPAAVNSWLQTGCQTSGYSLGYSLTQIKALNKFWKALDSHPFSSFLCMDWFGSEKTSSSSARADSCLTPIWDELILISAWQKHLFWGNTGIESIINKHRSSHPPKKASEFLQRNREIFLAIHQTNNQLQRLL